MAISSINTDVLRGNVTTIILGSLWNEDKYGYEILKEIEDKSDGHFKIKQPTLYNQLKRLEKQGLISSYEGDPNDTGGGQRCYYKLTDSGKAFLTKERSEYEYSRTILDKLVSDDEYDFGNPAPFDTEKLRPYSLKDDSEKEKIVYKDKIVEKVVEKKVYVDLNGNEITAEEAQALKEQQVNLENNQPPKTIDELFKEMDSAKVVENNAPEKPFWVNNQAETPKEYVEPNYYNGALDPDPSNKPESTLEELFKKLDDKHQEEEERRQRIAAEEKKKLEEEQLKAQEEQERKLSYIEQQQEILRQEQEALRQKQAEFEKQQYSYDEQNKEYIVNAYETSSPEVATLNNRSDNFEYESNDVNYKDFFASIAPSIDNEPVNEPEPQQELSNYESDLRSRIYRQGFKIRPYTKGNSSEYYSFNFIHKNRINRDTGLITMGVYIVLLAIMWLSMMNIVSFKYFVPVLLVGILGGLTPTVIYTFNPTRRVRAEFSLKHSLVNRSMLLVECLVIAVLIGVFGFHASIENPQVLYETIIIPLILFTCFPISSVIYWLLYRTKKYHIA